MVPDQAHFYDTLGLAMRAGLVTLGEDGVLKAIASGNAAFVLVDAGASANTRKKFADACAFRGVPLFETEPDRLGQAIGKSGRMSAALQPGKLADRLLAAARENDIFIQK